MKKLILFLLLVLTTFIGISQRSYEHRSSVSIWNTPLANDNSYLLAIGQDSIIVKSNIKISEIKKESSTVETINDLNSITNLSEGDYIKTLGYYNPNDKGGAIYQKVNPSGLTANGIDIIEINNGDFLKLRDFGFVNPYMFGCREENILDDDRLQRFFDYCVENEVVGDWRGTWYIDQTITIGGDTGQEYICGKLDTQNTTLDLAVSIESKETIYRGIFEVLGTTSALYSSRNGIDAISMENSLGRDYFENIYVRGFKRWGIKFTETGASSNIMSEIGRVKTWFCGSGMTAGILNFTINSVSNTGGQASPAQRSVLTLEENLPEEVELLSPIEIDGRIHIIKGINEKEITVYPWVKQGLSYPYEARTMHGGGVLINNNDSANIAINQIDAIQCGVGLLSGGLYGCSIGELQSQSCGIGFQVSSDLSNNNIGTSVRKFYNEGNLFDIYKPSTTQTSTVIHSVAVLNWDKIQQSYAVLNTGEFYRVLPPGLKIGHNGQWYHGNDNSRPKNQLLQSNNIVIGNDPKHNKTTLLKDTRTFKLKWSEDVNNVFGYETIEVFLVGNGSNNEPTGDIIFDLDSTDEANGITVMNSDSYTLSGFTNPTLIKCFFNYNDQNWIVTPINKNERIEAELIITSWDMDSNENKSVNHTLSSAEFLTVRDMSVTIIDDSGTTITDFGSHSYRSDASAPGLSEAKIQVNATSFNIERIDDSLFDDNAYSSGGIRGWINFTYIPE